MKHYSLALVRAAVVAGLPSLQVKFEEPTAFKHHATSSFFFPKLNLSMEQLSQLTSPESSGRHHPSLEDLKLALQSARELGEVRISSLEKKISHTLAATPDSDSLTKKDIKEPGQIGLSFVLQAADLQAPTEILAKRCRWAPLTWNINPKRLIHRLTKKDMAKDCRIVLYHKDLELTGRLTDIPHKIVLHDPALFPGLQFLAWRPQSDHESKLHGLKNGVTYPLHIPDLQGQLFCLIDCHELPLDAHSAGFVNNDAWSDKVATVRKAFAHSQSLLTP